MKKKILIVEDQFVEANDIQLILSKAGYNICGIARSVAIAQQLIEKERPDLVLLDIFLKGKQTGIDLAAELREKNIAFIYLSANSTEETLAMAKTTEPYGFIVKPFREKDLLVTLEIASYRHEHSLESRYRREQEMLGKIGSVLSDNIQWNDKLQKITVLLQQCVPFDYVTYGFDMMEDNVLLPLSFLRLGYSEYQVLGVAELSTVTGQDVSIHLHTGMHHANVIEPIFYNGDVFDGVVLRSPFKKLIRDTFQMRSYLECTLKMQSGTKFTIGFYSRRSDRYFSDHTDIVRRLRPVLEKYMESLGRHSTSNRSLAYGDELLNDAPSAATNDFHGVVGSSHAMLQIFDNINQVAPFDTSVLILGESGTGKERIADCIHSLSPRKGKPFVKVNCAALPATLIESELFGHEKGAFTGATDKRIGKFQQAHGGTIFLDEIGDMPVDMQVKLLRALQEREIEPIGSKAPVKINVRIIAATNRNLEKEVGEGRFRLDLYYRLNVFPISLPPLRERKDDIEDLVTHFIHVYNKRSGKKIRGLSNKVLGKLSAYAWPGNIRELENMIERSILLTKGNIIEDVALPDLQTEVNLGGSDIKYIKTIFENERDHILSVLKKTNGKIWGSGGAAELLNIPPTTLNSKMKKLGIRKMFSESGR